MYLFQIQNFFSKLLEDRNVYVVPNDMLPKKIKLPIGLVINLSTSKEAGSHWVALTVDEEKKAFYFDSYGLPPITNSSVEKFIHKNSKSFDFNRKQLQQEKSDVCGKYAAMFVLSFFLGNSPQDFVKDFTLNPWQNDKIISHMYRMYSKND